MLLVGRHCAVPPKYYREEMMATGCRLVMGIVGVGASVNGWRTTGLGRAATVLQATRMCCWVPVRAIRLSLARVWAVRIQIRHLMGMQRVGLRAVNMREIGDGAVTHTDERVQWSSCQHFSVNTLFGPIFSSKYDIKSFSLLLCSCSRNGSNSRYTATRYVIWYGSASSEASSTSAFPTDTPCPYWYTRSKFS